MKKTIDINLGGMLFHMDEDAYAVLSSYLEALRRHLAATEGREEVLSDIEARIAELFSQYAAGSPKVVTVLNVQAAMSTLGQPQDFGPEAEGEPLSESSAESSAESSSESKDRRRRLYRDADDKVIGGVCAGFANYFSIDVVVVRVVFLVLGFFTGFGFILYLILWAATPKAVTPAERLAMKGKPATFENIRQTVEEEFRNVESKINNAESRRKVRNASKSVGDFIASLVQGLARFFGMVFLVFALLLGAGILIAVFGNGILQEDAQVSVIELLGIFLPAGGFGKAYFWTATVLVLIGPLVALLLLALRLLFRQQGLVQRGLLGAALILSVGGIVMMALLGARIGSEFREEGSVVHSVLLPEQVQTWNLAMESTAVKGGVEFNFNDDDLDESSWILTDDRVYYEGIEIDLRPTVRVKPSLEWTAEAQGGSRRAARERAGGIDFQVRTDSTGQIFVGDLLNYAKADRFRGQRVQLTLYLPVGQRVHLDPNTSAYLKDVSNTSDAWDEDMAGRMWLMTDQGLAEFK
jgi:phage shock protein PspC (stress-responsive transcriptional regulator)